MDTSSQTYSHLFLRSHRTESGAANDMAMAQSTWAAATTDMITNGQSQVSDVLGWLGDLQMAEATQKRAAVELAMHETQRIMDSARGRIRKHGSIINDSKSCILELERTRGRFEEILSRLRHERYSRFADAQVNSHRAGLREKRPPSEYFKDELETNLENEQRILEACRNDLLEKEEQVKALIVQLSQLSATLLHDAGARRFMIGQECVLLKPSCKPSCTLTPRNSRYRCAATPSASHESSEHAADTQLALDGPLAFQYVQKSEEILMKSAPLIEACKASIQRSQEQGRIATEAVDRSLANRTADLEGIKRNLERQIMDATTAIITAEKGFQKIQRRADPADLAKASQLKRAVQVLEELKWTKEKLTTNLRCKTEALNIDMSCKKATPHVAAEKRPTSAQAIFRVRKPTSAQMQRPTSARTLRVRLCSQQYNICK